MGTFLVCSNASCRLLLDDSTSEGSVSTLRSCPECGAGWSDHCPNCSTSLKIGFEDGQPPRCVSCNETIKPLSIEISSRSGAYSGTEKAQAYAAD